MEFILIWGGGLVILGMAYLISTFMRRHKGEGIGDWPVVPGAVHKAFVYRHERRTPETTDITYTPVVAYTYFVGELCYASQQRAIAAYTEASFPTEAEAEAVVARYPVGKEVEVHYNPIAPQQAVLEAKKPAGYNIELVSGLLGLLLGGGMIALYFLL